MDAVPSHAALCASVRELIAREMAGDVLQFRTWMTSSCLRQMTWQCPELVDLRVYEQSVRMRVRFGDRLYSFTEDVLTLDDLQECICKTIAKDTRGRDMRGEDTRGEDTCMEDAPSHAGSEACSPTTLI